MRRNSRAQHMPREVASELSPARIYNAIQAAQVLKEMQKLPECKDDLPTEVDESAFEDAMPCDLNVFPKEVNGIDSVCVAGRTWPWGAILEKRGFKFDGTIRVWHAPSDETDIDEFIELAKEHGFPVNVYDGVEDDEDDEEGDEA